MALSIRKIHANVERKRRVWGAEPPSAAGGKPAAAAEKFWVIAPKDPPYSTPPPKDPPENEKSDPMVGPYGGEYFFSFCNMYCKVAFVFTFLCA